MSTMINSDSLLVELSSIIVHLIMFLKYHTKQQASYLCVSYLLTTVSPHISKKKLILHISTSLSGCKPSMNSSKELETKMNASLSSISSVRIK
jgi:hypothetical protein